MDLVFPTSLDNGGGEGSILPLPGLEGWENMKPVEREAQKKSETEPLRETGACRAKLRERLRKWDM